ncbi:unnamed protein product [Hymenolepis diminuta]|uniref:Uncharacterized protein n=1 Tax=Hymenolepis diminuta TaxID=6216 RepID=A0A564YKS6_HYMDI|nr:unnamed protein product [Hymenolepis diminuta]
MDELNLIQFPDENETCQTPTFESTNAENFVRGCKQCLHVCQNSSSLLSYSVTESRFSQHSTLTFHSGHTKETRGVPETLVMVPSTQFKSTFCLILFRSINYSAKEISRRVRTIPTRSRI